MKIKFLSIIASFFMVSLVITSCLGDDEDIEYSPDATIRAFELDTIGKGIKYKFTIDQLSGEIYNEDSIPVCADTIVDRILIKVMTTASGIVMIKDKNNNDSLLNISDSIDLKKYINPSGENKPLELRVYAPNLTNYKIYKLSIRKHNQDPDSLNWGNGKDVKPIPFKSGFSGGKVIGKQKAVILKENILVYYLAGTELTAYKTNKADALYGKKWDLINTQGIDGVKMSDLSSIVEYNDNLYMIANNQIYWSTDGSNWKLSQLLNRNNLKFATLLIGIQPDTKTTNVKNAGISAIASTDNGSTYRFCITDENAQLWKMGEPISSDFPTRNISTTISFSKTGVPFIVSMGATGVITPLDNDEEDDDTEETPKPIVPWSSYDGLSWVDLSTNSSYCPMLNLPSVITYNESLYAFGNDFGKFYISPSGLTWKEANKKFYFPKLLMERAGANYSIVIDEEQFIWIICSKDMTGEGLDDVWRGRLNKLGFEKQ